MPSKKVTPVWTIQPLGQLHDRAAFCCGNETLDRYIKTQASQDARRLVAAPFVAAELGAPLIVCGFYTLSAFTLQAQEIPLALQKKLPRYPAIPATLLGRLAVDNAAKGQGLGELLLLDALRVSKEYSRQIASTGVIAEAIDEPAADFYRHYGFQSLPQTPRRLFLHMLDIAPLFPK